LLQLRRQQKKPPHPPLQSEPIVSVMYYLALFQDILQQTATVLVIIAEVIIYFRCYIRYRLSQGQGQGQGQGALLEVQYVNFPPSFSPKARKIRYSKDKNDHYLNWQIVNEAREYGPWDKVVYYERPLLKKTRQAYAGQWSEVFSRTNIPQNYLNAFGIRIDQYVGHHESHAAAGFFTSPSSLFY
jgi:hypothetical protein